jgi:hypothetical protein
MDIKPDGSELAVAVESAGVGNGFIAFLDLQTLSVAATVVPNNDTHADNPYDVVYGREGRLYSSGNPYPYGGFDYIHVFDSDTHAELGRSSGVVDHLPRLAISGDGNTLFVGQLERLSKFNITTDTPAGVFGKSISQSWTITTLPDGSKVFSSRAHVWAGDDVLTDLGSWLDWGNEIEHIPALDVVAVSSRQRIVFVSVDDYSIGTESSFTPMPEWLARRPMERGSLSARMQG